MPSNKTLNEKNKKQKQKKTEKTRKETTIKGSYI